MSFLGFLLFYFTAVVCHEELPVLASLCRLLLTLHENVSESGSVCSLRVGKASPDTKGV